MSFEFRSKSQVKRFLKQSSGRGHFDKENIDKVLAMFDLPDFVGPREGKTRKMLGGRRVTRRKGKTRKGESR